MATFNKQMTLTMDTLEHLHESLKKRPGEDVLVSDPKGLRIELMTHQKQGLAWLIFREKQKPSGGILGTYMIYLL